MEVVLKQFLAMVPFKDFEWPQGLSYSIAEQTQLIKTVFHHSICKTYPPSLTYRLRFLKHVMTEAEERGHEVMEEVYELYAALVAVPGDECCFKSYNLMKRSVGKRPHSRLYHVPILCGEQSCFIGEYGYVTIRESIQLISQGTTGLTTWQAALHMVEWALESQQLLSKRNILELGSGLGLAGIALCRVCQPKAYCFTDCHARVMERLRENVEINLSGMQKVEVLELDWTSDMAEFFSTHDHMDYIVATDVIYDTDIIDAFVQTLEVILRTYKGAVGYVASTIRNEETYKYFCTKLDDAGMTRKVVSSPHSRLFYYDRTQLIEIVQIEVTSQ